MRFVYPRSFFRLLVFGFALAVIPLVIALFIAAMQVNTLAEKSQATLGQATQSTRASYIALEQIRLMERSARQYSVLQDPALLKPYGVAHLKFEMALKKLEQLPHTSQYQALLRTIRAQEWHLYQQLRSPEADSAHSKNLLNAFGQLTAQGETLLAENDRAIDDVSETLKHQANTTQRLLLWLALAVLPITLLIALLLAFLLARPIRYMDAAIRRLGKGEYHTEIEIDGPGDLRSLGRRLNWLRQQLDQLEHQKQQFLRHVSHELKTPLTAIREGTALLTDEVGGALTPQQQRIAGIVKENTTRLQTMIESILHYTATQHPSFKLQSEPIALPSLLDAIINDYRLSIGSKALRVLKSYQTGLPVYTADPERMRTIFDNLISNAVKYTPKEGEIELKLYQEKAHIMAEIRNSGEGIPLSDRPHIFAPFYRGKAIESVSNLIPGSGLGLSIVREYVEAHGGQIELLDSTLGTCFQVRLPLGANHAD